jgi:hypothetical protein
MSSAVISTSAAQGRFFVFDAEADMEVCPDMDMEASQMRDLCVATLREASQDTSLRKERWLGMTSAASRLAVRPAPEMVSSGIAAIDSLTGGLPRGCLTEIFGPASSGRTTMLLAALAAATRRGEFCAIVDASDALDPQSIAASEIDCERLLWVRCGENSQKTKATTSQSAFKFAKTSSLRDDEHRLEQVLRITDMLLESGGFGLIALDLCDLPMQTARRVPLTTWFRFRRAVEHTPTVLLAIERQSTAGSCSSLLIKLRADAFDSKSAQQRKNAVYSLPRARREGARCGSDVQMEEAPQGQKKPTHTQLFTGLEIAAEIVRSRIERKPAASVAATFSSKTAWAG